MKINLPSDVKAIIQTLNAAGHEAYVVGGCVRDTMLGRTPGDWDITTSAHPDEIKRIFRRTVDTGIEHGTVTVLMSGGAYEVTTYRVDGTYSDGRHPDAVTFTPSLTEDLKRRDFTINAMAYHPQQGIVDLFNGAADLKRGLIRAVGEPQQRFGEDALRMLRAVRFSAQLGFEIEESTASAIRAMAPRLEVVSAERIRTELDKLLVSPHPEKIRDAYELGLTAVFLPEFDRMMETPQNTVHHCFTVGEHAIRTMELIRPDRTLRLTMLLHDIAKPVCRTTDSDGQDHFKGHPAAGKEMADGILRRLKYDNDTRKRVLRLIAWHDTRPPLQEKAVRRMIRNAGIDLFPDLFEVKTADTLAQSAWKREKKLEAIAFYRSTYDKIIAEGQCVRVKDLAVNGTDLIAAGILEGPRIGAALHEMLELVTEEPERNNRAYLLNYINIVKKKEEQVMDARTVYEEWLSSPYYDEETKAELRAIADDEKEITERFYTELEFGTAGLRGIIGAGTNRMNTYTVRKATQGLANYILKTGKESQGVAISYDCRHFSPEFADEAALTLAANGIKAYVFETLRPTPELSYAVRYLGTAAGINITASHNPAEYNGYKVYWEDGAQITPPHDAGIMSEVKAVADQSQVKTMSKDDAIAAGLYEVIGENVDAPYLAEVKKYISNQAAIDEMGDKITVVYTPLHGTGNIPVRRILKEIGFTNVNVVKEQEMPDGAFPSVSYPNPEADAAFELGLRDAKALDADLVLATDPDADRLGVRVKDAQGEYHTLTGNMSAALICEYMLSQRESLPEDGAIVKSIVSTNLMDAIADYYKVDLIEVLTGFKWIGKTILGFEEAGKGTYLFGMEESYGCLPGTYARDKDAVAASMILCEAAAYYKTKGMTMWDKMVEMYERYGYYKDEAISITLAGKEGIEKIGSIMEALRADTPSAFGDLKVLSKRDYKEGITKDLQTGETKPAGLPSSNVIYYDLENNAWVCVRPSGTEPKIKLYYGVKGATDADAQQEAAKLKSALEEYVAQYE